MQGKRLYGNDSMVSSNLHNALVSCKLREVITKKHGSNNCTTVANTESSAPIDGIWCSAEIRIEKCGHLPFYALVPRTNHRTLWIRLSFEEVKMPPVIRPKMRQLQCKDPRDVDNFINKLKKTNRGT
jgi:hypothetical protein